MNKKFHLSYVSNPLIYLSLLSLLFVLRSFSYYNWVLILSWFCTFSFVYIIYLLHQATPPQACLWLLCLPSTRFANYLVTHASWKTLLQFYHVPNGISLIIITVRLFVFQVLISVSYTPHFILVHAVALTTMLRCMQFGLINDKFNATALMLSVQLRKLYFFLSFIFKQFTLLTCVTVFQLH